MSDAARIRIGRVRMKSGGADVRVIHAASGNAVSRRIREWTSRVLEVPQPPDAFFAIAFRYDDPKCASPGEQIAYETADQRIPVQMLPLLGIECLRREIGTSVTEAAIMRNFGYASGDDPDAS